MSDAALFSIFHRAQPPAPPLPPAPPPPVSEPVALPMPAVAAEPNPLPEAISAPAGADAVPDPEAAPIAAVSAEPEAAAHESLDVPEAAAPDAPAVTAGPAPENPASEIADLPSVAEPAPADTVALAHDPISADEATSPHEDAPIAAPPPAVHGPADFLVDADQLGLANPAVITLHARLMDWAPTELDASQTGIYRPHGFRPAPWSGFAYDQAEDGRTGLAAGTRILTSRGEIPVERLLPGDTALTLRSPALLPIAWIGRSTATAELVQIDAGAIGPDLPRHALQLAPDQLVYVDPVPVPAGQLVNGTSVRFGDGPPTELFHVDVGKSDILFAEGLALCSSERARLRLAS